MARPTGWDILGLDGDPTPGVVESVQALAKQFGDFAHDVEAAYHSLNSFGSDTAAMRWIGQTADAFKGQYGPLPGRLQKLYTSYSEASDALSAYAPKLQAAQTKADTALRQAQDAHADLQRATSTANNAATDLKTAQQNQAANPNQKAVTDAQTAHDTAQTNLNNAKAQMASLTKQANDAYNDRIEAAKACQSALGKAQGDGIHNKSWWDHVGEDLSEWGGKIADIANDLAPFLDVLALATSWIPGVDVVTAALAEADNIIALVGTGMQIAGDAMQGHWGDALMGAGMLGLQFAGGKLLDKVGGKLIEKIGARGNKFACEGGDPVDVVSGNMITAEADIDLQAVLPLVLRRAYSSGNPYGRLFGPGWSSTLDIRLSVNAAGIHFVGDDAQALDYPVPEAGAVVLPSEGARWPLEWDRDADEIRVTDPVSAFVWRFARVHHRDDDGEIRDLTSVTDRNGNRIGFLRNDDGTPFGVEHSGGYRLAVDTVAAQAGPRVTGLRLLSADGDVPVRTFGYDERGRLTAVVDDSGEPYTYGYDDDNRITVWTDRLGYSYGYEYDETGRVVRAIGDGGVLNAAFSYDDDNRANTLVNSLGQAVVYRYNEHGGLASITDPLGNALTTDYDRYGRLISGTDALGHSTHREYDEFGNTACIRRADGTEITGVFAGPAQPTEVRLPDGSVWRYTYDGRGRLATITDPIQAVTEYRYSDNGGVLEVVDPGGAVRRTTTDAAGLPVAVQDGDGPATVLERDAFGRVVRMTLPDGATTRTQWSVDGMSLWDTAPDGSRTTRSYDVQGQLVEHTDPLGGVTRFEYGPFGKITARTDASGARYEFAYDTELNLVAVTNPAGAVWSYTYDDAGRMVAERDFTGRLQQYTYDAIGQLAARVNGAGQTTRFLRGVTGDILERHTADGTFTYDYDPAGRLLGATGPTSSMTYQHDLAGRVVAETVNGRTVSFEYDAAGRQVRRVTPSGAVSEWGFDTARGTARLATTAGVLEFFYDELGREVERTFGGGGLAQQYDVEGRLSEQRLWRGDTASASVSASASASASAGASVAPGAAQLLLERTYSYRADDTLTRVSDSRRGTRDYQLDALGRVLAVEAATWGESYAYDAFGNIARAAVDTPAGAARGDEDDVSRDRDFDGPLVRRAGHTHYDFDAQGRMIRALRRTLSGGRKEWVYDWDADDRLVRVTLPDETVWQYSYDPFGRRIGKERLVAGRVTDRVEFSWDGGTLIEQSVWNDAGGEALTWDYDAGAAETWRPVAQRRRSWSGHAEARAAEEAFHMIVTDVAGTPTELVAPDGSVDWYLTTSLYGLPIASSDHAVDCPLRFPGQYLDDETGLQYNVHRYYDPHTGGYLSADPLGLAPAPNDHGYVPNPLTDFDPLGLLCQNALNSIQDRVDTLHAKQVGATGRRSTAIIRALDKQGNPVDVVGWSGAGPLDKRVLNELGKNGLNEVPAIRMDADAEISALATIRQNGWTPLGGAANRPVCPWCQDTLFKPFSAKVGAAQLTGPLRTQRIKLFDGKGGTIAKDVAGVKLVSETQFTW
ncbi:RHS repeat-associated protein [Catenulispora sp. MAP5-51]